MIQPGNKLIVVEPGEHSELGPSSSERWIYCPGSVRATRGKPNVSTEWTAKGSAWHALAELSRKERNPADHYKGWKIKVEGREFEIDGEMSGGVQEYLDKCDETAPVDSIQLSEVRVQYARWIPGGFGTTDDLRVHPEVFRDTDLKGGKGVQVWAKDNSQLRLYGLGAYEEFKWLGYRPSKFILGIHQPPLNHYDEEELTYKELMEWANDVLPRAYKEVGEGTRFAPGPWCKFCKIRATCRVRANAMLKTVLRDFENLDDLEAKSHDAVECIMNAELSPDELAKILPALENIKKWASHVEIHATRALMHGEPIGDWKLVEGRSNRSFVGSDEEVVGALTLAGVPEEECYQPRKVRSPAQVEEVIGKKAFKALSGGLVHKPPGKPKLAPGSDPRPAMQHSVLEEFENLDEDEE